MKLKGKPEKDFERSPKGFEKSLQNTRGALIKTLTFRGNRFCPCIDCVAESRWAKLAVSGLVDF